jgi:hypothetical protein
MPGDPAGQAAYRAGETHRLARQRAQEAEAERERRRRFVWPTVSVPRTVVLPLSPSDMRQIDAWVDWWYDSSHLFGVANSICTALGMIGAVGWALVSAFTTEITFMTLVVTPVVMFFVGVLAGAFATTAAILWALWKTGSWAVGLF